MMKFIVTFFLSFLFLSQVSARDFIFETALLKLVIDEKGTMKSVYDKRGEKEYLEQHKASHFLSIGVAGEMEHPVSLSVDQNVMLLDYAKNDIQIKIEVQIHEQYLSFEIVSITNMQKVDWVVWGPYPTTIKEIIGESVGVVRNSDFAFGIQALNVKTLGGFPDQESDIEPAYDIFETGDLVDVEEEWRNKKFYRGQTAKVTDMGSVLQAYSRNRSTERIISNWGHDKYIAPTFDDGGPMGSKIALFGCPEHLALDIIGEIEVEEGLPHPQIDGEWVKKSPKATASYLILAFDGENLDRALDLTLKAGLRHLYHGSPFSNWGHFDLNEKSFPENWKSMKNYVERAKKKDVDLGVHTLSNFISTSDPYVSPVPDTRLAKVGGTRLSQDLGREDKEIFIESPDFFNQMDNNTLQAVQIGKEIIRYRAVSTAAPWRLLDCLRGAYGTQVNSHEAGNQIDKLMDHGYEVFLSDAELSLEIAVNIARLFNQTGLKQLSFDGLEGVWSTGMGQYARSLFTKTWYDHLNPELQGKVINDASNPSHFNWHINTRYNWGEPWYAGFRESQTNYRLMNQDFYKRNLLPAMLGWFSMTGQTSIEDTEWLLARAAGFDAGFAFNLNFDVIEKNGQSDLILETINNWETARMAGAFSPHQKARMKDISKEFRLKRIDQKEWTLIPLHVDRFEHQIRMGQPGEPMHSAFKVDNPYETQPIQFILSLINEEGSGTNGLSQVKITVNQFHEWEIPVKMKTFQHLKLTEKGDLMLYDRNWQLLEEIDGIGPALKLEKGNNELKIGTLSENGEHGKLKIEIKTQGNPEPVGMKQ